MTPQGISEQLKTATVRSIYGGALLGAASALTTWQTNRGDMYQGEDTILAFAVTFIGYMIFRGAAEGIIDQTRASEVRAGVGRPLKSDIVTPA